MAGVATECPQLPPELWEHIHSFMPLERRLQARRVSSGFRALIDRGTAHVNLATVNINDAHGRGHVLPASGCLQLTMWRRAGYQSSLHAWTQARVDLPFQSREVLVEMRMDRLRPNGGYFNLVLLRGDGAEGELEVKFDDAALGAYHAAGPNKTTDADFREPAGVVAARWFRLHAKLGRDSEGQGVVRLSVNGALVKSVPLRDGWRAIRAVVVKGYNAAHNARFPKEQFYRHLVAAR